MPPRGFPRELLDRSPSERLGYFRSYTIAHPRLKTVSDALRRAIQEPAGCSLILVLGPTGVGKTTLRLRIEQELKEQFLASSERDPGRIPVIGFEAVAPDSGNFSWKDYYRRALRALEEPLIDHKIDYATQHVIQNQSSELAIASRIGNPELRQAMEQALRQRRPAAVLIDEAQHFTKIASGRRLGDQLDCLKSLASLTGCVHVLIGTYDLLPCRNLSAQLSRRSIDIHFRRYQADNQEDVVAFQRVIYSFQRHLPVAEEPALRHDWEYCYAHSMGCVGILKDWFTRTLAEVLEHNAPTVTRTDLERHAWPFDQCEKMVQEALDGEAILAEKPNAFDRLRSLLGLGEKVEVQRPVSFQNRTQPTPMSNRNSRTRRVGSRKPVRDEVGIHGTA